MAEQQNLNGEAAATLVQTPIHLANLLANAQTPTPQINKRLSVSALL